MKGSSDSYFLKNNAFIANEIIESQRIYFLSIKSEIKKTNANHLFKNLTTKTIRFDINNKQTKLQKNYFHLLFTCLMIKTVEDICHNCSHYKCHCNIYPIRNPVKVVPGTSSVQ